jgi:hypothetical protein
LAYIDPNVAIVAAKLCWDNGDFIGMAKYLFRRIRPAASESNETELRKAREVAVVRRICNNTADNGSMLGAAAEGANQNA